MRPHPRADNPESNFERWWGGASLLCLVYEGPLQMSRALRAGRRHLPKVQMANVGKAEQSQNRLLLKDVRHTRATSDDLFRDFTGSQVSLTHTALRLPGRFAATSGVQREIPGSCGLRLRMLFWPMGPTLRKAPPPWVPSVCPSGCLQELGPRSFGRNRSRGASTAQMGCELGGGGGGGV